MFFANTSAPKRLYSMHAVNYASVGLQSNSLVPWANRSPHGWWFTRGVIRSGARSAAKRIGYSDWLITMRRIMWGQHTRDRYLNPSPAG